MKSTLLLSTLIVSFLPSLAPAAVNLAHRWSFNGDLTDSVGGQTAQILDADNNAATGGGATLTATSVNLAGGANNQSSYVDLGAGVLGSGTTATLEMWATQRTVQNWSRIFDVGSANSTAYAQGGEAAGDTLIMSWTQGTDLATDRVEMRLSELNGANTRGMVGDNTNAPYSLNTEFHIAISFDNSTPGTTVVTWYSAAASSPTLGAAKGSFNSTINLAEFNDNVAWLGRSHWGGDATANADYNEFRAYSSLLTPAELQANHTLGVNAVVPEPAALGMLGLSGLGLLFRRRRAA